MTDQSVTSKDMRGKRALILEAARRLLVRRGYVDMVLDDVAREAGVAKGTLYLYFRSKDDLLASAFADLVDQLGEDLEALSRSEEGERGLLERTVRTVLDHFDRNRDFVSRLTSGPLPETRLREGFRANLERVAAVLRRSGVLLSTSRGLPFEAFALFALCRGALLQKVMTGSKEPLARRAGEIVSFLLRGAR